MSIFYQDQIQNYTFQYLYADIPAIYLTLPFSFPNAGDLYSDEIMFFSNVAFIVGDAYSDEMILFSNAGDAMIFFSNAGDASSDEIIFFSSAGDAYSYQIIFFSNAGNAYFDSMIVFPNAGDAPIVACLVGLQPPLLLPHQLKVDISLQ